LAPVWDATTAHLTQQLAGVLALLKGEDKLTESVTQ